MSVSLLTALLLSPPLDGVTVFAGDKPEPFQAIVLDTLPHALGPAPPMQARLKGAKIEHTGVIAGMGLTVYRDGQLIGAGYRFGSFSKEPIAGITPIDMMRDAQGLTANNSARRQPRDRSGAARRRRSRR